MAFNEKQLEQLKDPLLKEHVKQRDGMGDTKLSYLPSFHIIDEANRIFGFDGWDSEILSLTQVDKTEYEKKPYNSGDDPKPMISISYLAKVRVTVRAGDSVATKEDTGFGNGVAGNTAYGIGSCIELASKEAVTDAVKRCMRYFGNKFGNTLYDKDSMGVIPIAEYEAAKVINEDQLKAMRDLYKDRGIDDDWVLALLAADGWAGGIDDLRQDWYETAMRGILNYKKAELAKDKFEDEYPKLKKLVSDSVSMNMLKATFAEVWKKTTAQGDKEKLAEIQKLYETKKEGFKK